MFLYHEGTMTVTGQLFTKDPLHFWNSDDFEKLIQNNELITVFCVW